jgi:hypothetical protein
VKTSENRPILMTRKTAHLLRDGFNFFRSLVGSSGLLNGLGLLRQDEFNVARAAHEGWNK